MAFIIHLLILAAIFAILSIGLNLVVGYTGLLSVSHAAFTGIGAYATAILGTRFGVNVFVSALVGIAAVSLLSLLIGLVLSKFRDDYYVLGSVGFQMIAVTTFLSWGSLTKGPLGIPGIPRPELFGFIFSSNISFLILTLIILALAYLAARFIVGSSFGRVLQAIREDEKVIRVFGYNAHLYKLAIYVIGAILAAIAGSLFASYISFIDPKTFTLLDSVFHLVIIILGGLASLRGSVLGAFLLIISLELLRFLGLSPEVAAQARMAAYGLILILLMLYRPKGLLGKFRL